MARTSKARLARLGDTHSYEGWLNSDSFLKRALATYGYSFVGSMIVFLPLYFILFIIIMTAVVVGGSKNANNPVPYIPAQVNPASYIPTTQGIQSIGNTADFGNIK